MALERIRYFVRVVVFIGRISRWDRILEHFNHPYTPQIEPVFFFWILSFFGRIPPSYFLPPRGGEEGKGSEGNGKWRYGKGEDETQEKGDANHKVEPFICTGLGRYRNEKKTGDQKLCL